MQVVYSPKKRLKKLSKPPHKPVHPKKPTFLAAGSPGVREDQEVGPQSEHNCKYRDQGANGPDSTETNDESNTGSQVVDYDCV